MERIDPDMDNPVDEELEYVTATIAEQLFGFPIAQVLDVFMPERITRVPLAPSEVAGVLNLRGRVVTAIDMRRRLALPQLETGKSCMAIGIERLGESYALLVDKVGEVQRVPAGSREPVPANLDPRWIRVALGIHKLDDRLMVVLDIDRVLEFQGEELAA